MVNAETSPSRRAVLTGVIGALAGAACNSHRATATEQAGNTVSASSRRIRPLSQFGIDRFATRDQWASLARAFEAASAEGFDLVADPGANYRHDGALLLNGVSLDGQGCTLTALSDGPQVLHCIGRGWRVANLRVMGAARARTAASESNGLMIGDGTRPATDFVLENVTIDAVAPRHGTGGAGFMFDNASNGRIARITVRHSLADGIHITNGSHHLRFEQTLSEATGDDGFAVVSYVPQQRICHHISLTGGISRASRARGFTVAGGRDIVLTRVRAERSAAAGMYFYGEDSWNTYGVARCQLIDAVALGCSTGDGLPAGFSNGAIIVGGRDGVDSVGGEQVLRAAADCVIRNPTVQGAGAACTAAISLHQFAVRPHVQGGWFRDIGATGSAITPGGIEIGGRDVVVENTRMTDIAGLAVGVTRSASGRCLISGLRVNGSRLSGHGADSFIYVDQAKSLGQMEVHNSVFSRGPGRLAIEAIPDRMRSIGNRVG